MRRFILPLSLLGLLLAIAGPAYAATATVSWNANGEPDLAGYHVRYGTSPGSHPTVVDAGNTTSQAISGLTAGVTYYFVVTAYDSSANESGPSLEVSATVPGGNTPPSVTAPSNRSVEATGTLTAVSLGTASATDAEDGSLTATPDDTGPFAVGTHTITWTATDSGGLSAIDTQTVTVRDSTAPSVTAPSDRTVEATGTLTPVSLGSASATDLVDGTVTASADDTGPFARGTHTITWSATDSEGNTGTDTQVVTVVDTTAPSAPSGLTVTMQ